MKIRLKVPDHIRTDNKLINEFIDDVLLWGLETEMDVEYYTRYYEYEGITNTDKITYSIGRRIIHTWVVFNVESDKSFMFSLKYGALLHKQQKEEI
jgi:hypothetical protein